MLTFGSLFAGIGGFDLGLERAGMKCAWQVEEFPTWAEIKPKLDRIAYGVPNGVDRLKSLGNAVIPQIAEWIGIRILEYEEFNK